MRYKKFLLGVIASMLCLGLLNGCGHEDEISIKIETYLQEEYGEEFEVLSWNQPKLLPSDNGAIYATCISKNDPNHPFEGSYFNPEEPNSKIEIIYDGYAERLLAKQMESITEGAVSQVAENYYIKGRIWSQEEEWEKWQSMPVKEVSNWNKFVNLRNLADDPDKRTLGAVRPLINDFLRKMAKFRHQENQDVSAGTRIRFFIDKPAAMISFPRAVIKYL